MILDGVDPSILHPVSRIEDTFNLLLDDNPLNQVNTQMVDKNDNTSLRSVSLLDQESENDDDSMCSLIVIEDGAIAYIRLSDTGAEGDENIIAGDICTTRNNITTRNRESRLSRLCFSKYFMVIFVMVMVLIICALIAIAVASSLSGI
ncbi:hypothetical protein [Candidatus Ichthyocystis sparus]|uniref:hypothetical protein n=1 Tax=Candidatus Ichthyocystis sparus TaxID=1561004 RepID=UPI000B873D4C|nr:hypothetical protein [Candidatus Ichthyocystis sparus]